MVGPVRPQFVLFGSSIVQFSYGCEGWGATLADIYSRKADIFLRGYGGWNSRRALEVVDQVFPKDAAVQPSLVIVYFGGNDSVKPHLDPTGSHVPLPEYIENMRRTALHLKVTLGLEYYPTARKMTSFLLAHVFGAFVHVYVFFQSLSVKTRLLFLSTPPVSEPQIREITGNPCGELARTNERCGIYSEALIELCQGMDIKVIDLWNAIQKKDDWLTACFFEIVVEEIMKVLKEADWEPSLYWNSIPDEFADDSVDIVSSNGKAKNMANSTLHGETQRD